MLIKRLGLVLILLTLSHAIFAITFEDTIIRNSVERIYEISTIRLFLRKTLIEDELNEYLGVPIKIEELDKYQNYNSSQFKRYTYEGLEIIFIKKYEDWKIFRIDVLDKRYTTFLGSTLGDTFAKVTDKHGMPDHQEVIEPGLLKDSYVIEDPLSISRVSGVELTFIYRQNGPRMIVENLYVSIISLVI